MNAKTPPPPGLGWADTYSARAGAVVLAVLSLILSVYVGYRYVRLVDCLTGTDIADQRRTVAIADATDRERRADLALVTGPVPGGPNAAALRAADIEARQQTDRVRAANPAPAAVPCS
jgi:hypothetical protein